MKNIKDLIKEERFVKELSSFINNKIILKNTYHFKFDDVLGENALFFSEDKKSWKVIPKINQQNKRKMVDKLLKNTNLSNEEAGKKEILRKMDNVKPEKIERLKPVFCNSKDSVPLTKKEKGILLSLFRKFNFNTKIFVNTDFIEEKGVIIASDLYDKSTFKALRLKKYQEDGFFGCAKKDLQYKNKIGYLELVDLKED